MQCRSTNRIHRSETQIFKIVRRIEKITEKGWKRWLLWWLSLIFRPSNLTLLNDALSHWFPDRRGWKIQQNWRMMICRFEKNRCVEQCLSQTWSKVIESCPVRRGSQPSLSPWTLLWMRDVIPMWQKASSSSEHSSERNPYITWAYDHMTVRATFKSWHCQNWPDPPPQSLPPNLGFEDKK